MARTKEEQAKFLREIGKKGGRPKGKKNPKTLEREKVLEAMRQRIMGIANNLINSQLTLARGQTFLYKIEKEQIGTGKSKRYVNKRPVLVTNQFEIEEYLEGRTQEGDEDDEKDPGATYYFLTTKEPNNSAVESLFNRTFGTPVQSTKLVDDSGKSIPIATLKIESL